MSNELNFVSTCYNVISVAAVNALSDLSLIKYKSSGLGNCLIVVIIRWNLANQKVSCIREDTQRLIVHLFCDSYYSGCFICYFFTHPQTQQHLPYIIWIMYIVKLSILYYHQYLMINVLEFRRENTEPHVGELASTHKATMSSECQCCSFFSYCLFLCFVIFLIKKYFHSIILSPLVTISLFFITMGLYLFSFVYLFALLIF